MLSNANHAAKKGCKLSHSGKCKDCPHFRCMPFDVQDPTSGKIIKSGTAFDCAFAWMMMGAWDAGRQSQGTHAAVNSLRNRAELHHQEFISLVDGARNNQQRLPSADN